jgi:hypothetical protein
MAKKKSNLKSNCCNTEIIIGGISDFEKNYKETCTQYYICTKCKQACDIHINERKIWTRNPKTQIIGDKRAKIKEKEINKEIQEIGHA